MLEQQQQQVREEAALVAAQQQAILDQQALEAEKQFAEQEAELQMQRMMVENERRKSELAGVTARAMQGQGDYYNNDSDHYMSLRGSLRGGGASMNNASVIFGGGPQGAPTMMSGMPISGMPISGMPMMSAAPPAPARARSTKNDATGMTDAERRRMRMRGL